ncbi:hypothetical protein E3U55_10150 [Filobacillus milosensis]|uniref:Uncharacterized protein n=1 Tax=Filobacillus milosensis TaxID=94137 RepID=A0A4Y8IFY2_9BACI|nr:hypothetical protein [Filobacillus milosensis]TFB19517.1 hypothetical protein E3U55_10150 [Filobacillus milosensis]
MLKKLLIGVLFIILLASCNENSIEGCDIPEDEGKIEYEAFIEPTLNDELERDGYRKVNSKLKINDNEHELCVEIHHVADYYTKDHEYIKSEVNIGYTRKDKLTLREDSDEVVAEIDEPATILIPESVKSTDYLPNLSEDERQQIKEHVQNIVKEHLN